MRFSEAVDRLLDSGVTLFLEVGPHPVLGQPLGQCIERRASSAIIAASLRRGRDDWTAMLGNLAASHCAGCAVDWAKLYGDRGEVVPLPAYPFQRRRFWLEPRPATLPKAARSGVRGVKGKPLLGTTVRSASTRERIFEATLSAESPALLADHRVYERAYLPAAAYLEMAAAAGREVFGALAGNLEDCVIQEAMDLDDERTVQLVVSVEEPRSSFRISSLDATSATWVLHASGMFVPQAATPDLLPVWKPEAVRARLQEADPREFYDRLRRRGLALGTQFQIVDRLWWGREEALALLRAPAALSDADGQYVAHPALLDAGLQLFAARVMDPEADGASLYLPVGIGSLSCSRRPVGAIWAHLSLRPPGQSNETLSGDLRFLDQEGDTVAVPGDVRFKRASRDALLRATRAAIGDWLHEIDWPIHPRSADPERGRVTRERGWSFRIAAARGAIWRGG